MKQQSRQFWRRGVSLLLALVMIFLYLPVPVKAESDPDEGPRTDLDKGSDVLAVDEEKPEELDEYPEEVYGVSQDQPFLLSRQDELVLLTRSRWFGPENPVDKVVYLMDNIDMNITKQENGKYLLGGTNINTAEQFTMKTDSWATAYDDLMNPQSIGVDRDGTGRKEYIATIGIKGDYLYLYVQNAKTGAVQTYNLGETWMSPIPLWRIDNHMAITAGDYDGDGKESIIVFVSGKRNEVALWEYSPSGSGWSGTRIMYLSAVLRETSYMNENSTETWKPTVSLATGDFDGDGRDQLAFSAGYYDLGDVKYGFTGEADNLERFSTCVGILDYIGGFGWFPATAQWMYDVASTSTAYSSGEYTYPVQLMFGGVIAAGDVDNNGIDDIVVAGYTGYTPDSHETAYSQAIYDSNKNLIKVANIGEFDTMYACSVITRSGSSYTRTPLARIKMPRAMEYTWKKYCNDKYKSFSKLCIACGKSNGNNSPEDVFINGSIYSFENLRPEEKYTPPAFGESDLVHAGGNSSRISYNNWIRNVAVGNFNGNDAGREQFVMTFYARTEDGYYTNYVGSLSAVEFTDSKDNDGNIIYGAPTGYGCSLVADTIEYGTTGLDAVLDEESLGVPTYREYWYAAANLSLQCTDDTLFAVPVAVDVDDDGLLGRFNKSGYVYTDPEVLAVLEAGPYFGEIEEAGGYEGTCETRYSISNGFGTGTSRADNVSFEIGLAEEISAGPVKAALEAGYSMDWSHAYESVYTVTTTVGFAAQSEDVVVLSRVPVLIYTYDTWNKDTSQWKENGLCVRVPLAPRYFMLNIDEYNAFVDEYNSKLKGDTRYQLIKIQMGTDLPLDHEGNPDKYWRSWASAGEGNMQLSKRGTNYSLGYSSGYISSEYEVSAQETESEEISHGFHFGLTAQLGGDYFLGEAWAGLYTNLNYNHSTGHSKTKIDTTASGGQVQNIKASALPGSIKEQVSQNYGFKWNFGKWTRKLMQTGGSVPFYGYCVTDVIRRALPPQIADWTETVEDGYAAFSFPNVTSGLNNVLTVTKVSGDSKITYDSSAKAIKVAAGLASGTYTAVFKVSNGLPSRDTTFRFILKVGSGVSSGRWVKNANGWWYQRPDGTYPKNQWEKIDGKWYHFDDRGYMQTGWLKLSGKWYYLGTNGVMVTGWKQISGKWYYFNDSGVMITGWKQILGKWYWFNDSGVMITGWKQISNKWYYFNDSGVMITGWKQISAKWYYFESSGVMATGWKTISGKTYFFKSGGEMAAKEWCGGYYLNSDGTWTYKYKASWKQNAKGWWFGDTSGWYAKNTTITIDGKSYTFNANGYWVQ